MENVRVCFRRFSVGITSFRWWADIISVAKITEIKWISRLPKICWQPQWARCFLGVKRGNTQPSLLPAPGPLPAAPVQSLWCCCKTAASNFFSLNASHECHLWGRKHVCPWMCFPCLQLTVTDKIIHWAGSCCFQITQQFFCKLLYSQDRKRPQLQPSLIEIILQSVIVVFWKGAFPCSINKPTLT